MSILIVVSLLSIWFYLGWIVLDFVRLEDGVERGLLAPAVGMAVVTLITTTASLVGLPINQSKWIVILLLFCSFCLALRVSWGGFKKMASIHLFALTLNLCTFGIGLIAFGISWQGLVNWDAATNSLAAQYFTQHSFFAEPNIQSITKGLDYSPLSAMLYVSGGHRFGDVMLLGFSASLFNLNPDEVYMAHALAIRCTLIASAALLVYSRGAHVWKTLLAIGLLTLSPLAAYTFLNQLISQMGGLALLLAAASMFGILLDRPEVAARVIWPLAFVLAALSQSYPESVSLLILGVLLFGIYRARRRELPPIKVIFKSGIILTLAVLVLINASLPNVLNHMLGVTSWGMTKAKAMPLVDDRFAYAFSPDFFPFLIGFESIYERISEPWAFALQVSALALTLIVILFAVRRLDRYPLLISLCFAALIAFLFLFWQRNGFATFKMMLMAQPLIYALLSALLIELVVARNLIGVIAAFGVLLLTGRGGSVYLYHAMIPVMNIEKIQRMISSSSKGVIIESASFLSGQFSVLRPKSKPVFFEQNFPRVYAGGYLNKLHTLLPNQDAFAKDLYQYHADRYQTAFFQCGPPDLQAKFETLAREMVPSGIATLVPGGQLTTLNRSQFWGNDLLLLDRGSLKDFLVYRPSTLGQYYGFSDTVSTYNLESDVLAHKSMSATGRYMLLEILSPSEEDVRLAVRFTRTYMGAQHTRLPEITLHGAQSTRLGITGAGALSMTSIPFRPCTIGGRSYILVDFGSEPTQFKNSAPWTYRALNIPYQPDTRRLSGFLRDISIVSTDAKDNHNSFLRLNGKWDFDAFEASFEYSGMFEDGWMSDHLKMQLNPGIKKRQINIGMEIPIELAKQNALLFIEVGGKPVQQQALLAGRVDVRIDLSAGSDQTISLMVDKPLVLPGGDGRSVSGLVRSITAE